MTTKFDELVAKLTEIFQIDKPELDFGIYKVINAKAGMIRDFLNKDLRQKVQAALTSKASEGKKALEEKIAKIEATLASLGVQPSSSPEWVAAKEELDKLAANDDSESLVYAHLLTFFSRYYDDGDFISKRRYKEGQYVIPYSGEEVKLHWANADQYYTKSGENFTNYDFKLGNGKKVHFKLVAAATAKDNIKDNDCVRSFTLWEPEQVGADVLGGPDVDDTASPPRPDTSLEEKDGELYIYFQYKKFPKGTKKADILAATIAAVKDLLAKDATLLATYNLLAQVSKDDKRTVFEKQFARYTAKNTSDYFIHKDLRGFLTRELNSYVTNEMMNLDDISNAATFDAIAPNLRLIQTFRAIATELIGFMAQLEDFQKKLWLKKKFVVQCDWCVTISKLEEEIAALKERKDAADAPRIADIESLIAEAKTNPDQQAEWEKWGVAADPKAADMMAVDARMIDTKFFDEHFKARLLRALPDLDKQCDGLLVHSENFGALRMLEPTYHGKAKGIYIDPPYNTGGDGFLYRDAYKDSSWMSMILDRLSLGRLFCTKDGAVVASIDETEQTNFRKVFDLTWGQQNYIADFVWAAGRKNDSRYVSISHEYMLCFARDKESLDASKVEWRQKKKGLEDIYAEYEKLKKKYKTDYATMTKELKAWFKSLPDSDPAKAHKHYSVIDERGVYFPADISWPGGGGPRYDVLHPVTHKPVTVPSRGWIFSTPERMAEIIADGRVQFGEDEKAVPCLKSYLKEREYAAPYSVFYQDGRAATKRLRQIMGNDDFGFPKDETVIADTISCWTGNTDLFLDYFAGSGTTAHAVISLNREDKDQGHRKYILVEMGDHFDTVLKPRIEKVVYSPEWKDGKPVSSTRGISHCFKYLTLESYEDTLNNLKLETPQGAELGIGKNEYMMNYMLDIESRASLLSVNKLRHPFDYTLDIAVDSSGATAPRKVDLVETFNYLVGLTVETEDRHIDKGYVLVTGTLPSGEDAIILWRDCGKVDNAKLKDILKKQAINPRAQGFVLYVNGDHDLPNSVKGDDGAEKTIKVASIDAAFLEKMFAEE